MPQRSKNIIEKILESCEVNHNFAAIQNTGQTAISYKELKNKFTDCLFKQCIQINSKGLIAIYGEKNADYLQLMFSSLYFNQAYLPLDFYSPPSRIALILKNAGVKALFVDVSYAESIETEIRNLQLDYTIVKYNNSYSLICFKTFREYEEDVSHILYTSGSTGVPKGVVHTYESTMAFVEWSLLKFKFGNETNFISVAPFSFDISVMDIYACLIAGGKLVIPSNSEVANLRIMAEIISKYKINCIYSTPTFFKTLILYGKTEKYNYDQVKYIFIAGEQLYGAVVNSIVKCFPSAELFNLYGPTETNVCFYYPIEKKETSADLVIPIGKPCEYAGYLSEKNDANFELLISGKSLMKYYLDKSGAFENINGVNYYRSGDRVMQNSNGDWVFVGRKDNMVKRNGFRIELYEVETAYRTFKQLTDFIILATNQDPVKIHLIYTSQEEVSELQLRNFGLQKLPSYMIPDSFERVDTLSANSNYKTKKNSIKKL